MTKRELLADPESCLNRAADDEPVFVLLGRDAAAPPAISAWIARRINLKKNQYGDRQIQDAEAVSDAMVEWRKAREGKTA